MTGHVRVGGAWKEVDSMSVRVGGAWKTVDKGYTKVGGAWKEWFSASQPAMELIQTFALGSNTASITFSSIPQTYKHLRLVISARTYTSGTGRDVLQMRINGVSTFTNWSSGQTIVFGSLGAGGSGSQSLFQFDGVQRSGNTPTQVFTTVEMDFQNYTDGKPKSGHYYFGNAMNNSTNDYIRQGAFNWENNAAISTILLSMSNNGFAANSRISLYGIKGA